MKRHLELDREHLRMTDNADEGTRNSVGLWGAFLDLTFLMSLKTVGFFGGVGRGFLFCFFFSLETVLL